MARLTAKSVEAIRPDPDRRVEVPDGTVSGLFLIVQPSGAKSWAVRYRVGTRTRKLTIGRHPALSLVEAREKAREALRAVDEGRDPAYQKQEARRLQRDRWETVAADFVEGYAKKRNRSWQEQERILRTYVTPRWKGRDIHTIARRDVLELLDEIAERAPVQANRVLATIRRLFNWCIERDVLPASPVAGVKAPAKEVSRDRVLTDDELRAVWRAWDGLGWPFGAMFKLLLLTAQRREEVARMAWPDIDLEAGIWTIPREMTKTDRANAVPLSPAALAIIETLPRHAGVDLVFPGQRDRKKPVQGFSRAKTRTDEASGVTGWRLHDLRRTAASGMARHGVPPHVVEKVLNHQSGVISGVAAVYNRFGYDEEKRHALNAWAAHVEGLLSPRPSNVVEIR